MKIIIYIEVHKTKRFQDLRVTCVIVEYRGVYISYFHSSSQLSPGIGSHLYASLGCCLNALRSIDYYRLNRREQKSCITVQNS